MATATKTATKWNEIKFELGAGLPQWVYRLVPGDELKRSDGRICIFERAMQKNIAFRDDRGKSWRGRPYSFVAWRHGNPDNLAAAMTAAKQEFTTDANGARNLQVGDVALFMLSTSRIYVAKIEGTANQKTISARDLSGKGYRYPLDSFVMKLPPDKFPG